MALYDETPTLFTCPICRKMLSSPVTADCGHSFCVNCLDNVHKCATCGLDVGMISATNCLVQDIVCKFKEIHDFDHNLPAAEDILGIEPRYCLRSRNAGLQPKIGCHDTKLHKVIRRLMIPTRRKKLEAWQLNRKKREKENNNGVEITRRQIARILKNIRNLKEKALREVWRYLTPTDLECILCSRCFLHPITTKCGHTFCKECLARVIDHGLACPLCMSRLTSLDEIKSITYVIEEAVRFLFPDEYHERLESSRQENEILEKDTKVPVFVCTNAFPGVACPLYVYEPRYRLLARRCLQSQTRRFAMAARIDSVERFARFGTILEVKDAVHLHDGTSILTTVGVRRFKVLEKGEQDGYDTATIQYIKDTLVPNERLPALFMLHQRVYNKAARWVHSLSPRVLAEVENCIGKMPDLEEQWYNLPDGPSWAWWLMPILPLSSKLQVGFLYCTDLEKRLRAIDKMLEHVKVKMKALKRKTLKCNETDVENSDSCRFSWVV